jgi:hypothetical protein
MYSAKNQFVVHNILPFPIETAEGEAKGIIPRQPYQFLHHCIEKGAREANISWKSICYSPGRNINLAFSTNTMSARGGVDPPPPLHSIQNSTRHKKRGGFLQCSRIKVLTEKKGKKTQQKIRIA